MDSLHKRLEMRNFDVFLVASLNKQLNKQSNCLLFKTLWRSCNAHSYFLIYSILKSSQILPKLWWHIQRNNHWTIDIDLETVWWCIVSYIYIIYIYIYILNTMSGKGHLNYVDYIYSLVTCILMFVICMCSLWRIGPFWPFNVKILPALYPLVWELYRIKRIN